MKRAIFTTITLYLIISFGFNTFLFLRQKGSIRPFEKGWYSYERALLSSGKDVFNDLTKSIKNGDEIFISQFEWPRYVTHKRKVRDELDLKLANDLNQKKVSGVVYMDPLGFDFDPKNMRKNPVVAATSLLHWISCDHVFEVPNSKLAWFFSNPLSQKLVDISHLHLLEKLYSVLRITINHQKVVVINQGKSGAWLGSKNFDDAQGWYNFDHYLFVEGPLAQDIYYESLNSISEIDQSTAVISKLLTQARDQMSDIASVSFNSRQKMGRVLRRNETKEVALALIENSAEINIMMYRLVDHDMIEALNRAAERGAKINVLLDSNKTVAGFNIAYFPNLIAFKDLSSKIVVRIFDPDYESFLHAKSALFELENGSKVLICGSANWTKSSLVTGSFNDLGVAIVADEALEKEYKKSFNEVWQLAKSREDLIIDHLAFKAWLAKLVQSIGVLPY